MTRATFYITLVLAVLFAGFTVSETWMYKRWETASLEQRQVQSKLAYAQRLKTFTDQFMRRLAIDSQHDAALADLLKRHNIKVIVSNAGQSVDTGQAASGSADKTAPAASVLTSPNPSPAKP